MDAQCGLDAACHTLKNPAALCTICLLLFSCLLAAAVYTVRLQSEDKTLKLVNNMWHGLVKEDGNRELLQEIIQWMETRVAAAAEAG